MKRVVVFFPSWRYFGHFALPLFEPLAERFEIVFFHTEKAIYGWDDCPDLTDKGIEAIDLKSLGTRSFVKALKKLRADCVVVFDKGWVQDRALLHAAKHLGIPTLHIQHGIIAALSNVKTKSFIKRVFTELLKTTRTLWLYNATLLQVGLSAWLKSFRFQARLLLNPNDYYYNHRNEVTADKACVIGERDRVFFVEKEGYREDQLIPMGALQFERAYAKKPREPQSQLLLISQPLFEDHVLEGGMEAKKKHLREIIEASPLPMAIKPHPRESMEWYCANFGPKELVLYPADTDINDAILDCSHVVGYFSTALVNALILERPIGIIRWVDNHAYVLDLDLDGEAISLVSPGDITKLVKFTGNADAGTYAYDREVLSVLNSALR